MSKMAEYGRCGMVSASREEAAQIGIEILQKGGNAFDAAAAVSLALSVCEPQMSGLGGGGFATVHCAASNKNVFVDFREVAPEYAEPSIWATDENGALVNDDKMLGGKSVCVPGTLAGICHILEDYGTMPLHRIIEPAIQLAFDGYMVDSLLSGDIAAHIPEMKRFAEPGNVYLEKPWKKGDILKNPALGKTLSQIAENGPDAFYRSELTEKMIRSLNSHGARFTAEDFAGYHVCEYEPLKGTYRGYDILSSPPPSSGGTHVLEGLNILENFPLQSIPFQSSEHLHILSETLKMIFSDRAAYMGDPAFTQLPLNGLLNKSYATQRAGNILYGRINIPAMGDPFAFESPNTTHFSVADQAGNLVSWTQTISQFFGSGIVPQETGIVMNCQMRGFAVGAGKANSVAPGKKPLSSMSPSIMLKDGRPFAVLGSPGANRIISSVIQVISNLVDYKMNIVDAVLAPRVYNDTSNLFKYEMRCAREAVRLESLGQACSAMQPFERFMGGVNAIELDEADGMLGVADPRRNGAVVCCTPIYQVKTIV